MSDHEVCGCGRGYVSARDGKCGHCRTKKEIKAYEDEQYRIRKRIAKVQPVADFIQQAIMRAQAK